MEPENPNLIPQSPAPVLLEASSAAAPAETTAAAAPNAPETAFAPRTDFARLTAQTEAVRQEIGKIIVGQADLLELLLTAVLADGHVLLEGVPGVAKTLMAKLLARTLAGSTARECPPP